MRILAKSKYESFETQVLKRSEINLAKYNPRIIDSKNQKALNAAIKKHGLVEPLVYNKRTGNLVSGHQRISQIDKLEKGNDYELTFAVVDVDEKEEAILNVKLNNKNLQGDFDFELLGNLSLEMDLKFEEFGFDKFDVDMMFSDDERFAITDSGTTAATKDEIRAVRESRENMNEEYDKNQNADYWFVVVCESKEEREQYLKQMSVPLYEKYVTSKHLQRIVKD